MKEIFISVYPWKTNSPEILLSAQTQSFKMEKEKKKDRKKDS